MSNVQSKHTPPDRSSLKCAQKHQIGMVSVKNTNNQQNNQHNVCPEWDNERSRQRVWAPRVGVNTNSSQVNQGKETAVDHYHASNHLELNTWARKNVKLFVLCLDKLSAEMTIIVRNNTPGSDLCKLLRATFLRGCWLKCSIFWSTYKHYIYLNIFQDRLANLPSRPSISEFQHPPYFPPPFAASGPASAASADVFTPVSLQHLQTADPYHVTTSLQNFSPPQVSKLL